MSGYPLRAELDGWDKSLAARFLTCAPAFPPCSSPAGAAARVRSTRRCLRRSASCWNSPRLSGSPVPWIGRWLKNPSPVSAPLRAAGCGLCRISMKWAPRCQPLTWWFRALEPPASASTRLWIACHSGALPCVAIPEGQRGRLANQGAARMIRDEQLTGSLLPVVHELLEGEWSS